MSDLIQPHRTALLNRFHVDTCYPGYSPLYDTPLFSVYFLGEHKVQKSQGQFRVYLCQHEFSTSTALEKKLLGLIHHACVKTDRTLTVKSSDLPSAVERLDSRSVVFVGKKVKAPNTVDFIRHPGIPQRAAVAVSSDELGEAGVISFRGISHHYGMSVDASRLAWFHVDD